MSTPHTVVVIGASFGGLPVAHGLLKDVLPASGKSYKLILINPTQEFWWKIGAPRALTRPNQLPLDKSLVSFLPAFEKYGDKFEFVQGLATAIDPAARTVTVDNSSSFQYDSLVIATGTYFESDIWSTSRGSEKLRAAIKNLHDRLPEAKSILIAGGGPAGVETSGELGEEFGGKKEITLLSGSDRLLKRTQNPKPAQYAQGYLEKMGLKVIHNVRVASVQEEGGSHVLTLSNGETKTVDIYINATGDKPNSGFVPKDWLTPSGQIMTDENTLRVNAPEVNGVYCIGTVASYSDGNILDTKFAYKPLLETIKLDLSGQEPGPRSKDIYKKLKADMLFAPVGSQRGVGVAFGWSLPSFLIRMAKGKDFMIGQVPKLIEGQA